VYGLKPYIREELQMHNITTMDKARCKEKIIENKLKRSSQKNLTMFIQGENHPKAQILEIQGILHASQEKRIIIVWKPNDEGREMQILWRQVVT
jgi:hypothetical protein